MGTQIVHHKIDDNQLRINNKEYFGFHVHKVITGVENENRQEIVQNPNTGLNYARNAVEGQEIYNLKTQKHHPWFLLDLETGKRGWFPGCEIHGDILEENVEIRKEPNLESEVLGYASNAEVKILEINSIQEEPENPGWYKVSHIVEGYVQKTKISNIRYSEPF